jgi:hypothetical protein
MPTKLTFQEPSGEAHFIPDLRRWVKDGDEVEIEDPDLAARMLQSDNWKGRTPRNAKRPAEDAPVDAIVEHTSEDAK